MAAESGALALGVVREVKPVMAGGVFRSASEVPLQWTVVADDETVKFEAPRSRRDRAEIAGIYGWLTYVRNELMRCSCRANLHNEFIN